MAQVSDVSLANQGFSAFRTELNNILAALNSMHSGTSRPSSATTGTIWLDTTNSGSNSLEIKFYDGSDDISFATVDTSANTINFIDSTVSFDIVSDTSPQLGGDLDTNSSNIKIDDAHGLFDENNNEQLVLQTTASAVNYAELTNAATGNNVGLSVTGSDTNVGLDVSTKGNGKIKILPIDYNIEFNSHHPYNRNNGSMVPNRGYQHILSARRARVNGSFLVEAFGFVDGRPQLVHEHVLGRVRRTMELVVARRRLRQAVGGPCLAVDEELKRLRSARPRDRNRRQPRYELEELEAVRVAELGEHISQMAHRRLVLRVQTLGVLLRLDRQLVVGLLVEGEEAP